MRTFTDLDKKLLAKLAPCIERGELEAWVEEGGTGARKMGIGAEELLEAFFSADG
jgi:hypothetical protein